MTVQTEMARSHTQLLDALTIIGEATGDGPRVAVLRALLECDAIASGRYPVATLESHAAALAILAEAVAAQLPVRARALERAEDD